MAYYNTTRITGEELKAAINQATSQEEKIYLYFQSKPAYAFTPEEVQDAIGLNDAPITSIRRAMTNLTNENKLVKTNTQRLSRFKRPSYAWRLAVGGGE